MYVNLITELGSLSSLFKETERIPMKYFKLIFVISFLMFAGCAKMSDDLNSDSRKLWPVSVIPWENAYSQVDSAEVVILCLVDTYDQIELMDSYPRSGPSLFASQPRNNLTPGQMLHFYLRDLRRLEGKELMTLDGAPDLKKMTILIVECGKRTRDRAGELFAKYGVSYYDNSIPVIYVFHKGQLAISYTYTRNPGMYGAKLRTQVSDIFEAK